MGDYTVTSFMDFTFFIALNSVQAEFRSYFLMLMSKI